MKTLAKYHASNHCTIGEKKIFKNKLTGPGKKKVKILRGGSHIPTKIFSNRAFSVSRILGVSFTEVNTVTRDSD